LPDPTGTIPKLDITLQEATIKLSRLLINVKLFDEVIPAPVPKATSVTSIGLEPGATLVLLTYLSESQTKKLVLVSDCVCIYFKSWYINHIVFTREC